MMSSSLFKEELENILWKDGHIFYFCGTNQMRLQKNLCTHYVSVELNHVANFSTFCHALQIWHISDSWGEENK
jgi:hypothetical protein